MKKMKQGLLVLMGVFPLLFGIESVYAVTTWISNEIAASDIAVGPGGKIWIINEAGVVQWDTDSPDRDQRVQLDSHKEPIKVDKKSGRLIRFNRGTRKFVVLDPDRLDTLRGIALRIAVDPKGRPWVVTITNDLYRLEGKHWKRLPGKLSDIAIGINGAVWGLAARAPAKSGGHSVLKLNGTSWEDTGVVAENIGLTVDDSGEAWILSRLDAPANGYNVFRSQSGSWQKMPGLPRPTSITSDQEGSIWVNSLDRKYKRYPTYYKWGQSDWEPKLHMTTGPMAFTQNGNPIFPGFYTPEGELPSQKAKGLVTTPNLSVTSFTIDTHDVIWAIRNSKPLLDAGQAPEILKWNGQRFEAGISTTASWKSGSQLGLTDMLRDLAVDQSGSPWVLGSDYYLYRRTNNTWVKVDNRRLLKIVSSPKGDIWAIDESPRIRSQRHKSRNFGFGHQLLRWSNGALKKVGEANMFIYNVAIDKNDTPWITSRDTSIRDKRKQVGIYRLEQGSWVKVPVPTEFSISEKLGNGVDGGLWLGARQGRLPVLLKWTGSQWEKYSEWYAPDQITGDSTGKPWALMNGGFVTMDTGEMPAHNRGQVQIN